MPLGYRSLSCVVPFLRKLTFGPAKTGSPNVQPLLHYQKTLDSSSDGGDWRIVDELRVEMLSSERSGSWMPDYRTLVVDKLLAVLTRRLGRDGGGRQGGEMEGAGVS